MAYPHAISAPQIADADHDALIIISDDFSSLADQNLSQAITTHQAVDARIGKQVTLLVIDSKRVILAPTGPLNRDYDDVRRYFDAAKQGILEAKASGSTKPALYLPQASQDGRYQHALEVAFLGACQALWQPLEAREFHGQSIEPISQISLIGANEQTTKAVNAIAAGQYAARDLCGTEPERMAPPRFADYCVELFAGSKVSVEVISDINTIDKDYPMMSTVARASYAVERHHPRVVKLEYVPEGDVERTLMFVGKGLVYDTGGADLKVGGFMVCTTGIVN